MLWSGRSAIVAMQATLDSRAMEIAAAVDKKMDGHVIECRDRYIAIDSKLEKQNERFESAMSDLQKFLWKIAIGIITLLLVMIGWLVIQLYSNLSAPKEMHKVACAVTTPITPG